MFCMVVGVAHKLQREGIQDLAGKIFDVFLSKPSSILTVKMCKVIVKATRVQDVSTPLVALIVGLDVVLLLFGSLFVQMFCIQFDHFHIQSTPFENVLTLLVETVHETLQADPSIGQLLYTH